MRSDVLMAEARPELIYRCADAINLTVIGVAVFVSMDIPEIFLAVRSSLRNADWVLER